MKDIKGRYTLGVWCRSPMHSLRGKLLWKEAIILHDMIWRERNVPREHHQLPKEGFDPNNFPGKTPAEKFKAASTAAEAAIKTYAEGLAKKTDKDYPRPDQGYVTLDNVKIGIVEAKLSYTDPNPLLDQIDKSIYSVYLPESTISGMLRSTYASEAAKMLYSTLKAETVAEHIGYVFVQLAKEFLTEFSSEDLSKISFTFRKILETHSLVRDAAILLESKAFTPTEVRKMLGFDVLSNADKTEISEYAAVATQKQHTESLTEIATTGKRAVAPKTPVTPTSEDQQQLT